ncbi:ArsA family ATPase [Thermoflavimicrobium dichotomicum]|uniref:arsenite-transporting ATPase n=1 Tax=Thermoflavimicrobium dichotomicum TaxID=46223 RepID=A0A1I3UP79_9BACL|nr:ArsA family ATPase [Thermoflavimicrobium dichotomicum]SFJ84543.1 arsenite-transporting ATPase [Thermoflavimicrobium dichotomicum]
MRIIVYTGKGGVGKTSVAAATGVRLASEGLRTLIMSTDAAHNLSDCFLKSLGPEPVQITENLWGQEVDHIRETERNWKAVQTWLKGVMNWSGLNDVSAEEILTFPGMEELFSLLRMIDHVKSERYDVLIIDCAPTGETLRLLSYPNMITWWLDKIFPFQRRVARLARPVTKLVTGGFELPDEESLSEIEQLFRKVIEIQNILLDHATTSIRVVVNPEKIVIAEARRAFTYLNLYGFNTDAIIVNRMLPEEAGVGYWEDWKVRQAQYIQDIEGSFHPIPVFRVPLMKKEVAGIESLQLLANEAFGEKNPKEIFYVGKVEEVEKTEEGYVFYLAFPFVERTDLNLTQRGDELTIQVGSYRRKVYLPRLLTGRPILEARFTDQRLRITFGKRESEVEK